MPVNFSETFKALNTSGLYLNEADFKNQLKKDPKGVYNAVNTSKVFVSYEDFENQLGLKKKDGGIPFSGVSPVQDQFHSPLPSGGGKQKTYAPNPQLPGLTQGEAPKQAGIGSRPWEEQTAPTKNPLLLYEQTVSSIISIDRQMDQYDPESGGPVMSQWKRERADLEKKRNNIIETMRPLVQKPVEDLITSGQYKNYFQDDAFDIGKARSYFDAYVKKVGGGQAFRELLVSTFEQKARETKDAPEINKIMLDVYKKNGIDVEGWGKPFLDKKMSPFVSKINMMDGDIEKAQNSLLTQYTSLANDQTKIFNANVAAINEKIKAGTITQDQGKAEYGKMLESYKATMLKIESNYKTTYSTTLSNMWKKRERYVNEYNAVAKGIDYNAVYESLTPEQKKKIELANQEAQIIFNTNKNVKKKIQDEATGLVVGAGVLSPLPYAGLLGKSIMSGWNSGLASIGNWMMKNGYDNSLSHSLAARGMQGEILAPAQYEWSRGEFMKRIVSTSGTSLGASAPALVPSLLIGSILGPGAGVRTAAGIMQLLAGTTAIGVTSWATERMQNSGALYRDVLQQTGDVSKATNAANRFERLAYEELPYFMIGGLADMFLMGAGKTGRKILGFAGEQIEEMSTEIVQSHNEAKIKGYNKSRMDFIKENPEILYDTFFATIGQSSVFATAGAFMSSLQNKVPENQKQFFVEAIQRNGVEFATAVLAQYKSMGVINEAQFKQGVLEIDDINNMLKTVSNMGYNNDLAKAFISTNYQIKALDNAAASEQNPVLKQMYESRSKKLKEAIANVNQESPYVVVTLPGGAGSTRTLMADDIYRMERDGTLDDFILNSDGVTAVNDTELDNKLKTLKSKLGNPKDAPEGLYVNNTQYATTESTQQVSVTTGNQIQPQGVGEGQQEAGVGTGQQGQTQVPGANVSDSNISSETLAPSVELLRTGPAMSGVTLNPDGTTYIGPGLVVSVDSENVAADELSTDRLNAFMNKHKSSLATGNYKVGMFKLDNGTVSLDLNLIVDPKNKKFALEFAKASGQHSIYDMGAGEVIKTGATGQSPVRFTPDELASIGRDLAEGKVPSVFNVRAKEELGRELGTDPASSTKKLEDALAKTGVKVVRHETTADYRNTVSGLGGNPGSEGIFNSNDGTIHLDMQRIGEMEREFLRGEGVSGNRVVWHEGSHPVINILRNTNRPLYERVVRGLEQLEATNAGVKAAKNFAKQNRDEVRDKGEIEDEFVVETAASIADGTIDMDSIPESVLQSLFDFFNKIAEKLGISGRLYVNDKVAAKRVLGEIADALTTGTDIAKVVGEGDVKEFQNNLNEIDSPEAVVAGNLNIQPSVSRGINVYQSKEVTNVPVRSISDIYDQFGGRAVVINSDTTRVGWLVLPSGKKIFMYGGPGYLSISDNVSGNVGFATTAMEKIDTWSKYIKDLFGNGKGVTLIGTQAPGSMLSNSYALRYVLDVISLLPKSVLRSSDFKNEFFGKDIVLLKDAFGDKGYNEFVAKYKKADLSSPEVIDDMIAEMGYKLGGNNSSKSFRARRAFVENLLGGTKKKKDQPGYISVSPKKFIAKELMKRFGLNQEKLFYELGEKSLVDLYMNEGKWGMAVAGFETDPSITTGSVQENGVSHPLFNAKFPGTNPFILDGAYDLTDIFTPIELMLESGPYMHTVSKMAAGSIYAKGTPQQQEGTFEFKQAPSAGGRIQTSAGERRNVKNEAGKTQGFFSDVVSGISDKYKPIREWKPVLSFDDSQSGFRSVFDKFVGNFDLHIATSIPTFRETQVKVGSAIVSKLSTPPKQVDADLNAVKEQYKQDNGIESQPVYTKVDPELFKKISEYHSKIKDDRSDPEMAKSYDAFLNETLDQYNALVAAGYVIEPWMGKGEPYGVDSNAMRKDLVENKHLYYLRSRSATGEGNEGESAENYAPFRSSGVTINGDDVLFNDLFRAVHDIFGHGLVANTFSTQGEFDAYNTHAAMFSKDAQKALFLETVVYNAYYSQNKKYAPRKIYDIPDEFISGTKPLVYDLGGSEGGFVKAITEVSGGNIRSINLDPNPDMKKAHESKPVDGSTFVAEAFYEGFDGFSKHIPEQKADIVHESMMFQFITPERENYIKEVKDKYIKDGGLFITEEKFSIDARQYAENERKKAAYKDIYYTKEQQAMKSDDVLVGMKENQANLDEYKKVLSENFKHVEQYWDSGNFKGFVASDSKAAVDAFMGKVGSTESEFTTVPLKNNIQTSTGKRDLVEAAGKRKMMTEDANGNYIFFHYSGKKLNKIDPGKFGANTRATGRDERPGIGISMYYTEPDLIETNVPDDYGYVVRVPKGEVYPFNEDPLNLLDEAEREFKKTSNQAFDFNKQAAWVSKVAEARGYKMTVAEWNIGNKKALRAQTTEAIKPELFRERDTRYSNVYKTKPEFQNIKSNRRKKLQESRGSRVETDRDFKLAAFAIRKKQEGMTAADIKATMSGQVPATELDDLVDNTRAWLKSKYPSLSAIAFENLYARTENKNIYPSMPVTPGSITGTVADLIDNRDLANESKIEAIRNMVANFSKRWFNPAKGLPDWVIALKDFSSGVRDVDIQKAKEALSGLKKVSKRVGFNDWDAFSKAMANPFDTNGGLSQQAMSLPGDIIPYIIWMRGIIDRLSTELITSGYVTPDQAATIESNIGAYVNRAYRMFNERGYKPSKEVYESAVRTIAKEKAVDIRAQNPAMTDEEVYDEAIKAARRDVEDILNKKKNPYFKSSLDSRDTGILNRKLDIPAHIRAVMGEYVDPGIMFMMTIGKQASLKAASYHLSELRRLGMGTLFFEKNDPNRPPSHSVEVASLGTESKSPLGGLYTTQDVADILDAQARTHNDLVAAWMKVVGAVRWGKTVASITTQFKNFESNLGFAVMNGLLYSGKGFKSFSGAGKYVGGRLLSKDIDAITERVIRLGIVNSSVDANMLKNMLGSGDINDIALDMALNKKSKWSQFKGFIGKPVEAANWAYRMGDDFWKTFAYLNEREQLADAFYDSKYDALTDDQRNTVDIEASERVKNTWPTYSRVFEAAKYFAERAPILGNFVAFNAEVLRILPNTIRMAADDIRSDNPKIRNMGLRRMAGVISYAAFRTGVTYGLGVMAGTGIAGIIGMLTNDDDEERRRRALKTAAPDFMATGDLMVMKGDEQHKFTIVNMNSVDPYGILSGTLNAYTEGREGILGARMNAGPVASMVELANSFLEPEMTFETVWSALSNRNIRTNERIVIDTDTNPLTKTLSYIWKNLEPSTISLGKRLIEKKDYKTESLAVFGMRPYEIDLHQSYGFILSNASKEMEDINNRFNRAIYKAKTDKEKADIETEAEQSKARVIEKLHKIYQDFVFTGADPIALEEMIEKRSAVKITGFDKRTKKGIITGEFKQDKLFKVK